MSEDRLRDEYPEAAYYRDQARLAEERLRATRQAQYSELEATRLAEVEKTRLLFNRWSALGFIGSLALERKFLVTSTPTNKRSKALPWLRPPDVDKNEQQPTGAVHVGNVPGVGNVFLMRYGNGIVVPKLWCTISSSNSIDVGPWDGATSGDASVHEDHDGILTTHGTIIYATPVVDLSRGCAGFNIVPNRVTREVRLPDCDSSALLLAQRSISGIIHGVTE